MSPIEYGKKRERERAGGREGEKERGREREREGERESERDKRIKATKRTKMLMMKAINEQELLKKRRMRHFPPDRILTYLANIFLLPIDFV